MTLCLYLSPGGGVILEKDGAPVPLRPKEKDVLRVLSSPPGRPWTRSDLAHALYPAADGGPDTAETTVAFSIHNLRRRFGEAFIDGGPKSRAYTLGRFARVFTILGEIARVPGALPADKAA